MGGHCGPGKARVNLKLLDHASVPETSLRARVKDYEAHRFVLLARAYFPRYLAVPHGKEPKTVGHLGLTLPESLGCGVLGNWVTPALAPSDQQCLVHWPHLSLEDIALKGM